MISLSPLLGQKKGIRYPVTEIPDSLKENANVVIREDVGSFDIVSSEKAIFTRRRVVTIFNEKGARHGYVSVGYDKLVKVQSFSANAYNLLGMPIKKMKKDDITDESSISGGTMYDDSRIKWADLRQKQYPYTVEYKYVLEYKYLYGIPNWYVVAGENMAVQRSEYSVSAPKELTPRYRQSNIEGEPKISNAENRITYQWKFENLTALEYEPFSKGFNDVSPIVRVAPSKFDYDGYSGDMSSWDGLAEWQNVLNEGRDELPAETVQKIKSLTADLSTDKEKIRAIYEYMQSRTRYVSIQLGIGGFQPFEAKVVDEVGYGDCKALSFYTQSLLSAAGIKSHYTWVDAGSSPREIIKDFPDDTFNHIILCVPNKGDTVWLECTSQQSPFGYLGKFTADRDVLLITDEGGKVVHTPTYENEENQVITTGTVKVIPNGNAEVVVNTQFVGLGYEYSNLDYYMTLSEKEQKDWIHRNVDIADYELFGYEYDEEKDEIPVSNLKLDLGLRKLLSGSGKRQFLAPNIMSKSSYVPKSMKDRKTPIYIKASPITRDTLYFEIPDELHVDHLPEKQVIDSEFGQYSSETIANEKGITYIRYMKLNKGKYDPEKYSELVSFLKKVRRADKKKVVLMNGT